MSSFPIFGFCSVFSLPHLYVDTRCYKKSHQVRETLENQKKSQKQEIRKLRGKLILSCIHWLSYILSLCAPNGQDPHSSFCMKAKWISSRIPVRAVRNDLPLCSSQARVTLLHTQQFGIQFWWRIGWKARPASSDVTLRARKNACTWMSLTYLFPIYLHCDCWRCGLNLLGSWRAARLRYYSRGYLPRRETNHQHWGF